MADNGFRSNRRDPLGRDGEPASQEGLSDPLAELARLIGQTDPHGGSRDSRPADPFDDPPASPEFDWAAADHGYAEQTREADDGYAPPRPADGYRQHPSDPAPWPTEREYEEEAPPVRQYFRPPPAHAETHEDMRGPPPPDVRSRHEPPLSGSRGPSGSYFPAAPEGQHGNERQSYGGQAPSYVEDYPHDEYDDEPAPSSARRSGTVVILAIIGLAVLGTAGALGYRAMFGGSVIPTLPPIIKPGQGPIKILPNRETQSGTPGAADAGGGSGEHVVPRQEQPVDLPAGPPTPRVVTTIPVIANPQGAMPMGGDPAAAMPNSPPPGAQPNGMAPSGAVPGFGPPPDQMGAPPMPAPDSRDGQTLPVRPDQGGGNAPGVAPPPAAAHPVRTRDVTPKPRRPVPRESGGPLSIVPGQDGDTVPEPQRTRTALARPPGATPMPLGGAPARETAIRGGEFSVQVSSQRSEGEAEAAFRSLQGRFPQQLGGRRAMIRRADLGAKGIYYRALVGPFGSSEQAAELCSSLKAAGGSCLIQRN